MVRTKIASEFPEVDLDSFTNGGSEKRIEEQPKEIRFVGQTHIDATEAIRPIESVINYIHDYRNDKDNTKGKGVQSEVIQKIAVMEKVEIVDRYLTSRNKITARWVIDREIRKHYPKARGVCLFNDQKSDAKVEITSPAYQNLCKAGESIVDLYLKHSTLTSDIQNPYKIGPIKVNPEKSELFINSLHSRYSGLNNFELSFARAIDDQNLPWVRNPSNGGYSIPLLMNGATRNFFPDFLVWKDDVVYALDPKADNLIVQDAGHKLFDIRDFEGRLNICVRLFTKGKWSDSPIELRENQGFTVWAVRSGRIWARDFDTMEEAVQDLAASFFILSHSILHLDWI